MAPRSMTRERLGQLLLDRNLVTIEQLNDALKQQTVTGRPLGEILIAFGYVKEKEVLELLSQQMQVPYFDLSNFTPTPEALSIVPREIAQEYIAIPLFKAGHILTVAMSDPLDLDAIARIHHAAGCDINPALCSSRSITAAIEKYYPASESGGGLAARATTVKARSEGHEEKKETEKPPKPPRSFYPSIEVSDAMPVPSNPMLAEAETRPPRVSPSENRAGLENLVENAKEAPVIRKVNNIVEQAVNDRASDIHFEPGEKDLVIRYRIDGVLHSMTRIPKDQQDAVISRIKIMANIDIAERRLPQDGRIHLQIGGKDVDNRISTFPTIYGESVVMRILVKSEKPPTLTELGFSRDTLKKLQELLKRPNGIILVTGPTGSGKTTTLYAALSALNTTDKNIITLEDPVEYRLSGIRQSQISAKAGLTFAQGLRAIVRQDPDVIMVGEIRDLETAQIAIHAALTGHLVFSTLHTNDAAGAVARLVDMGVEPFLVASSVIGVVAQRLVRLICQSCKESVKTPVSHVVQEKLKQEGDITYYHGKGCNKCKMTGYRGRSAIVELMIPDPIIRQLIIEKAPSERINEAMVRVGMPTLMDDGLRQVVDGLTTLEEILRQTN